MKFVNVEYNKLNNKQQENYNFAKICSRLADFGYSCIRLTDDYNGADFLAIHIGGNILRVQLKGRLNIESKYVGKNIYVAFPEGGDWYLYPHDEVRNYFLSYRSKDFSCKNIPKKHLIFMSKYKIPI